MAIHQIKKQSDLEKRLRLLRQQVYGKEKVSSITSTTLSAGNYQVSREDKSSTDTLNTKYIIPNTDVTYLSQDLLKITLLASLALGAQIILFYLMQNNILKNLS